MSKSINLDARRFVVAGLLTAGLLVSPLGLLTSVHAQSSSSAVSSASSQDRMTKLQDLANKEINKRIASLKDLNSKIENIKKLTNDQKSTLTNGINNEISNLTTLQTKVNADKDLNTLKADVKSIVQSYRVYALYMPQVRLIIAADKILDVNVTFNDLATKLNTRIQTDQSKGKDVTALTSAYNDIMAKINDSNAHANTVLAAVTPLTPAGYPGNKVQLTQARTDLKTAFSDQKAARLDVKIIIDGLKALRLNSAKTSSSVGTSSSLGTSSSTGANSSI